MDECYGALNGDEQSNKDGNGAGVCEIVMIAVPLRESPPGGRNRINYNTCMIKIVPFTGGAAIYTKNALR